MQQVEKKRVLAVVEDLWCSFGHPAELNGFIRWMPAVDPVATKNRSVEENLRVLRLRWEQYMNELDTAMLAKRQMPEV